MLNLKTITRYQHILKKTLYSFKKISYKYEVAICCIVKDEDGYLPEWIAYHRKIGVEHFYIYDNESTVPVATLLEAQIENGLVTVEVVSGQTMQLSVYHHCIKSKDKEAQWIAFIDADEFIVVKSPLGDLPGFLKSYKKYGGLGVNWLVFGSNGHVSKQVGQLHHYTKRTHETHPINRHIKSIVQPRYVKNVPLITPHHFSYIIGRYCINENFERVSGALSEKHSSSTIQINHYMLRSLEEYKEKIKRGRADIVEDRGMDLFFEIDSKANDHPDDSILKIINQ